MSELEEIRKLEPEERIKRLKEMEDERKREIEEAEALIRDSMLEIGEAEVKRHAPIEQVKAHDLSQLVTGEEKEVFKTARFATETRAEQPEEEINLEEMAEDAKEDAKEKGQGSRPLYGQALEDAKAKVDYSSKVQKDVYSARPEADKEAMRSYDAAKEAAGEIAESYHLRKQREEEERKRTDYR
ncbi:hypothetical protein HYX10_03195 [Candidatus Woesearchaeota archaeon]|nr:hypothetical protein [Candidatus Woesearchaeota archaeon]